MSTCTKILYASIFYLGMSTVNPLLAQTPITLGETLIENAKSIPGSEELNTVDEVEKTEEDIKFQESSNSIDAPSVLAKDLGDDDFFDSEDEM